jgi:hypothetical protein
MRFLLAPSLHRQHLGFNAFGLEALQNLKKSF